MSSFKKRRTPPLFARVGVNKRCPCNSGKSFHNCCIGKGKHYAPVRQVVRR